MKIFVLIFMITIVFPGSILANADFPPDPGEQSNATITGEDSDGDGTRDDVQRFIAEKYPDSELIRTMLGVYAKGIQAMIVDAHDKDKSIENTEDSLTLTNCSNHIIWRKKIELWKWMDMEKEIRSKVINTSPRKKNYEVFNNLGGMRTYTGGNPVSPEEAKKFCPFNPDVLKN